MRNIDYYHVYDEELRISPGQSEASLSEIDACTSSSGSLSALNTPIDRSCQTFGSGYGRPYPVQPPAASYSSGAMFAKSQTKIMLQLWQGGHANDTSGQILSDANPSLSSSNSPSSSPVVPGSDFGSALFTIRPEYARQADQRRHSLHLQHRLSSAGFYIPKDLQTNVEPMAPGEPHLASSINSVRRMRSSIVGNMFGAPETKADPDSVCNYRVAPHVPDPTQQIPYRTT